jgi:phosphoribosylformimino-5-aminoimidazole carboxamide ribotide isomerase
MIIFPAIDLRGGRCVRLRQGDPAQETVFSDNPVEVAQGWAATGAEWLHIVNLDGAFESRLGRLDSPNISMLREILTNVELGVQFGGGIRSMDDMDLLLEMGVDRLILGTSALQNRDLVAQAAGEFGAEAVMVGIDTRGGKVATHGWTKVSQLDPVDFGRRVYQMGISRVLYTDISRDGTLEGVNVAATARLAKETGLLVIASGGVASLNDVRALRACEPAGVEGAIIGSALYTGALDLAQAIRVATGEES